MQGLDLTQLFEQPAFVSAGKTGDDDLKNLTKLAVEEIPSGFHNWVQKRQREYRCGRHHARRALAAAGASVAAIRRDDDGLPVFPSGFHGSITHTGRSSTFAAAVVAAAPLRVGIDAEDLRTLPEDMITHIVSDDERTRFAAVAASGGSDLKTDGDQALLAFSAKEAFYKCIFPAVRCRLNFHDVEFRLLQKSGGERPGAFQVTLLRKDVAGAPSLLAGKYLSDGSRLICGVSWRPIG